MRIRRTLNCAVVAIVLGALSVDSAQAAPKVKIHEFTIVGTYIEFDEYGLPMRLEGDILYRGGKKDGKLAGTYTEELTPILYEGMLVGTSGVSIFEIKKTRLTTLNTSNIVGMADGAFLVETTGKIVEIDGKGKFKKVDDEFVSSSTIILGPEFSMEVNLTLSTTRDSKGKDKDDQDNPEQDD